MLQEIHHKYLVMASNCDSAFLHVSQVHQSQTDLFIKCLTETVCEDKN